VYGKLSRGAGPLIASSIMPVVIVGNHGVAVRASLLLSCVGLGMCTSNLWSVTQTSRRARDPPESGPACRISPAIWLDG